MSITLFDINTLVNDKRRDSGSNSIDMTAEGFRAINSTLMWWNQSHDWEFQIEKSIINYNEGATWYSVPTGYKAPIDLLVYKSPSSKEFAMKSSSSFDSETLETNRFAIATRGQTEYLRIKTTGDYTQIHTLSGTASDTWAISGAISNIDDDPYESYDLNSSLKFDYSGTSGAYTITLTNPIDLTKYLNRSSIYFNSDFVTYSNWTSITLRLGSSASAYYTGSVTSDYLSATPTANQWNKHKIAWSSLTKVGNPDISAINYIQFIVAYSVNPSMTAARMENLFISENVPLEFEYYSTYMAATASTKSQIFSSSSSTGDTPLWSGKWDFITDSFVNSTMETIFWLTGEYDDMSVAQNKVAVIVNNLKQKMPSRRRYPETNLSFEI